MEKPTKSEKKFRETQEKFRLLYQAEPLQLMVGLVRLTLTETAKVLEEELSALGIPVHERDAIYKKLLAWRQAKETELYAPLAYEKQRAQAKMLGLLDLPSGKEAVAL
jgi:hypothetical protein